MHDSFVFFGTPYVAKDTLATLIEHGYTPSLVVTNPDAPRGRGQVLTPSETKILAEAQSIPVITPEQMTEAVIEEIAAHDCTYGICVAYGKILPKALIASFPKGILNIHYSLLPKYRGASPVEYALLNNESETGVTIQQMVFKMDAGDILAQASVAIGTDETAIELRTRLIPLGAELLIKTLPSFLDGPIPSNAQDATRATLAPKIPKEARCIDLSSDDQENWNKYRAYAEGPGTHFFIERDGKEIRVKITKAAVTPDGHFTLLRVIPEGKKEMDFAVFMKSQ